MHKAPKRTFTIENKKILGGVERFRSEGGIKAYRIYLAGNGRKRWTDHKVTIHYDTGAA